MIQLPQSTALLWDQALPDMIAVFSACTLFGHEDANYWRFNAHGVAAKFLAQQLLKNGYPIEAWFVLNDMRPFPCPNTPRQLRFNRETRVLCDAMARIQRFYLLLHEIGHVIQARGRFSPIQQAVDDALSHLAEQCKGDPRAFLNLSDLVQLFPQIPEDFQYATMVELLQNGLRDRSNLRAEAVADVFALGAMNRWLPESETKLLEFESAISAANWSISTLGHLRQMAREPFTPFKPGEHLGQMYIRSFLFSEHITVLSENQSPAIRSEFGDRFSRSIYYAFQDRVGLPVSSLMEGEYWDKMRAFRDREVRRGASEDDCTNRCMIHIRRRIRSAK